METASTPRNDLALQLAAIASRAGEAIMVIYNREFGVADKEDGSPLTEADLAADLIIVDGLATLAPGIPVLSEETAEETSPAELGERFFVVDPLDGTREFISRNGDFTVNIALVEDDKPVAGVVYAPARRRLWLAGEGAFVGDCAPGDMPMPEDLQPIRCRTPSQPYKAVASRSHCDAATKAYLASLGPCETMSVGSALKLCLVAEGKADVYPRLGPTMVWDTAAGVAVVEAAGGVVKAGNGEPLHVACGPNGWRNGPFVVWGCTYRSIEHPLEAVT